MTSMLPAPRDLPPRRRNQIRAELERTIAQKPRRARHAPLIAALAAVAVLAGVVLLVPWQQAPTQPAAGTSTTPPPTPTSTMAPAPVFPGLPAAEQKSIETGCAQTAGRGPATLFNLVTDEGGKFALLYNQDTALHCTIGSKVMPYNSGFSSVAERQWLPGEFAVDVTAASAGGSVPGGKAEYRGDRGFQVAAGRISPKVAKVTYTEGNLSVDAVLTNGTFVARIVHSATWQIPSTTRPGSVRAYDANGQLLGETGLPTDKCYVTPDAKVIGARVSADPRTCLPATRWR